MSFKKLLIISALLAMPTHSAVAETIGTVETTGMFIKDSIRIEAFDDPTIGGVSCYVTVPSRAMSFDDPSDSALACRRIGVIKGTPSSQPNIFSAAKNAFFKTTRVDRFYDARRNVLVYISYTEKTSGDNHSHSLSVVPLGD